MLRSLCLSLALGTLLASPAFAVEPGKAVGTVTIGGVTATLAVATESTAENLFDDKKKDTIITLTDKPLGGTDASDDIELSMRARKGELVVLMLRIDGTKLVNVGVMYKGLSGVDKLPGAWFQYAATSTASRTRATCSSPPPPRRRRKSKKRRRRRSLRPRSPHPRQRRFRRLRRPALSRRPPPRSSLPR